MSNPEYTFTNENVIFKNNAIAFHNQQQSTRNRNIAYNVNKTGFDTLIQFCITSIKQNSTQLQRVAVRGNVAAVMGTAPSWNLEDII